MRTPAHFRLYCLHCGQDSSLETGQVYPYFVFVIEHPRGWVLFDTGGHPSLAEDASLKLGPEAANWRVELTPSDGIVQQLERLGLVPGDLAAVVMSHLHFDHAGGLEFIADVPVHVQALELDNALAPPKSQPGMYAPSDYDSSSIKWRPIARQHDLFDDGTLVCVPTPGHTPGHQSLLVRLQGRTVFLLGDAAYSLESLRTRALPPASLVWSPDTMIDSWERIESIEREEGALLLCTHELDRRLGPDEWYE